MEFNNSMIYLSTIMREIKRSFENPVILLTLKDYADTIFTSLMDMREVLLDFHNPDHILHIITSFHESWVQAAQEVELIKKKMPVLPREHINQALEFTKTCATHRYDCLKAYAEKTSSRDPPDKSCTFLADLNAIKNMQDSLISVLNEKQTCFSLLADQNEYNNKVDDELQELLNWLDDLNNHLAVAFSRIVGIKFPHLLRDLATTLKDVIDQVTEIEDEDTNLLIEDIKKRRDSLNLMSRVKIDDEEETRHAIEKINSLENRADKLKDHNSAALLAIQHKSMYLEEKLNYFHNLRNSLIILKSKKSIETREKHSSDNCNIFDHLLPAQYRSRLVEQLLKLWRHAIHNAADKKSIISILSINDLKETFTDEIGKFTVDRYGRKIYIKDGDGEQLYQTNEKDELVPLQDEDNVYYYDNIGRYYINENKQRVYQAHAEGPEYIVGRQGLLLLHKEHIDGVDFCYDELGRYYADDDGRKIYNEPNSDDKYEHDGFGNLVRIRDNISAYKTCPREPAVTEDNKYLQRTVGCALRKCIAEVILKQPFDPIRLLADSLERYRIGMQIKEEQMLDKVDMMAEREQMRQAGETNQELLNIPSSGSLENDYNFIHYRSGLPGGM